MAINADLSQNQIESMLNEFDTKINNLRMAYDRYFNGADRRPPVMLRTEVVRMLHQLEHKTFIQNTAQRFRLRSLVQRFTTHKTYWDRILRQIEEGTYKKHLDKAKRNMEQRERFEQRRAEEDSQQQHEAFELDLDAIDSLDSFASELNQMAQQGQFDHYNKPAQQPSAMPSSPTAVRTQGPGHQQPQQPQQPRQQQPAAQSNDLEARRAQKIAELQRRLGIEQQPSQPQQPAPQAQAQAAPQIDKEEQRRRKLEEMKRRLESRSSSNTQARPSAQSAQPTSRSNVQRASQQRAAAQRQQPKPQGGDSQVERVYRNLVEAKRRCNEPTGNLTRDAVARSMQQQRARLKQSHGSDNVDFKVIIKNGKAFLKPEPK